MEAFFHKDHLYRGTRRDLYWTFSDVFPAAPARTADITTKPGAKLFASPRLPMALLTSATFVSLDNQVTYDVTSICEVSENVPVATYWSDAGAVMVASTGVMSIDVSVALDTVT